MTAAPIERSTLGIWIGAGVVAVALHAGLALPLLRWHDPVPGDDGAEAVLIDLAPVLAQPETPSRQDLAPGPEQQEAQQTPEPPKEQPQRQEEKTEPLPEVPNAEAVLPKPVEKPVERPLETPRPPSPVTTAPPRPRPSAAQVSSWHRRIAAVLERHKSYPAAARAQGEVGIATVTFSIGRDGRLLSSRLVHASHSAALDAAALATVHRAAPFPPPPADLPGQHFEFTVPIRFNMR